MPDPAPPVGSRAHIQKFALAAGLLTLVLGAPLWQLFRFAVADDFYSYIPLIPLVSGYLAWLQKASLPDNSPPARGLALLFSIAGLAALAGYFSISRSLPGTGIASKLALATLAWQLFLAGAGCWLLGGPRMRVLAFPFGMLIFMLPFPQALRDGIEVALQHGSAAVADGLFSLAGMSFLRDGMLFRLPGINFMVAPECSGIHSTWILFITSLVAGWMILRRPWNRAVLCLVVIPLALLRNGFRVFVLGELCVHVSPRMIDSPIHHRGGPLFFVLSLVPFFLLLYWLKRTERTAEAGRPTNPDKS